MATTKYIFYQGAGYVNFIVPSDFGSLVSLEALGGGGAGFYGQPSQLAGGGGGAYSKTLGSSVTVPIVAGVTTVYCLAPAAANSNELYFSWIAIGDDTGRPTSTTYGVSAQFGSSTAINVGGAGGLASSGIGDIKYSGGTGGAGSTSSRGTAGGGGGAAGHQGNGGDGGAAYNLTNRGHGGGGGTNNGSAGSAGTSSAGGAGGSGGGGTAAGGAGGTSASPSGGFGFNSSSGAGGGGGGYGAAGLSTGGVGSSYTLYSNAITGVGDVKIGAGGGGGYGGTLSPGAGRGGTNVFGAGYLGTGSDGWVLFTYLTADTVTKGNFFSVF